MIRDIFVLLCMASAIAGFAGCSVTQPAHLFILSGQSNMVGLDPDKSFTPLVQSRLGEVIVVKDAHGGQPIRRWYRQWAPNAGATTEGNGDLYARLLDKIEAAVDGRRIASITLLWMQGESDAMMGFGDVYGGSLRGLIDQLKEDLHRDDINVVLGRLSDYGLHNHYRMHWQLVRDAQMAAAEESEYTAWINTDDLNDCISSTGQVLKNDLHYCDEGYIELGERFAEEALALIARRLAIRSGS